MQNIGRCSPLLLLLLFLVCSLYAVATEASQSSDKLESEYVEYHLTPDQSLNQKFANSNGNHSELVRAVRESLREYELYRERQKRSRVKRASAKRVCYEELGCFEDSGPFAYLEMLPSPPQEINTKFFFYSTKNRSDRPLMELPFLNMTETFKNTKTYNHKRSLNSTEYPTELSTEEPQTTTALPPTRKSTFQKYPITLDDLEGFDEMSVRVIVHGFGSACPHVWIYEMKTALMAVEDCIVICVDWENGATFPNYVRAATNTRLVGKQLAMLLKNLQEYKGLNLARTHIIGFSLGAHVSGFAGAELPGLSRITGLDPAGPLFEAQHPKVRLDSTDAEFVDVIHSNGENLILGGLGSWQPMGDVDFYPNGGRVQTGCSNLFVGAVTDFIWSAQTAEEEEGRSLCNHRRAYKFFIDSVAPRCLFPAFPCDNYDDFLKGKCFPCAQDDEDLAEGVPRCGNMGYYADRSSGRGQLYLLTREEEPFCAHQFQLQIFNSFNDLPLRTIGRLEAILEGEGGLNETFQISEKDDSEFFAGDIVSKIIVPHPALGFPTTLSLNYKHYSGWLSKGLPHWDIDKVILTDSYGRSHSICNPNTKLSTGSPVRMKLKPGNCELDNQEEYGAFTSKPATQAPDSTAQESIQVPEADAIETIKKRKNFLNLGSSFKLGENQSYPLEDNGELPWQPILEGNSLDKDVGESSRSFSEQPEEIFEPILNDRRLNVNRGRNLNDFTGVGEIMEPVLKATTPRVKKGKEIILPEPQPITDKPDKFEIIKLTPLNNPERPKSAASIENDAVTVQLFPFRLGELLQRAERYARETILPLISVQAPRFFGFNVAGNQETQVRSEHRKPRYIPRFEENAFKENSNKRNFGQKRRSGETHSSASREQRNIFALLRPPNLAITPQDQQQAEESQDAPTYYTNVVMTASRSLKPENPDYEPVFIDLPTYKPPKARTARAAFFTNFQKLTNFKRS
uniref:Lipase domain-containing protein n=1 Tax=Stomoxys calcitrans TaxID=35570 RepID=A0A1I8P6B9_STOCA